MNKDCKGCQKPNLTLYRSLCGICHTAENTCTICNRFVADEKYIHDGICIDCYDDDYVICPICDEIEHISAACEEKECN